MHTKYNKKEILHLLLPAQLPTNFQQRITRYGALSKPSKSGAGSPLSSQTDPSFRLVNLPVHLKYRPDGTFLNFNRVQRRYTLFPPKLSTSPLPSTAHPHTHDTFVAFLNGARALAAATLLNSPLKRDAGRFMAGPSLRFRHVSS